ncbi:GGDEF domain-containing protein [Noviherbaspirillum pedocola]|uniref:diguanylate cyclase n=1 Tax=Noviherbaspirillum pedocola TaxID=2801341 RepID=A0A934T054_9BURK|nr:GGDEF domain-containing protein [Noviherbaspirillum pedocola]MBK4736292.1 GGDEF domain-containing protein [Noviherbaspirillum pedocola]
MILDKLLDDIVCMTAAREHETLDAAMLAALCRLTHARHCVMLDLLHVKDQGFVQPRSWMSAHGQVQSVAAMQAEPKRLPIARYPVLAAWMRDKSGRLTEVAERGVYTLWLPVWLGDILAAAFRIDYIAPLDAATRPALDRLLQIYTNHRQLIDYSERDSLTGLLNRKTFDTRFARMACQVTAHEAAKNPAEEERRRHAGDESHWLAVVDIDHFKRINDRYGHLYGDEVLILIANILRASFRAQDRIFRFGGEEFVILLRSVTLASARRALERFRENVEHYSFPQVGRVTLSIGFTGIGNDSPVEILGHADQALYYAKQHGRNQVRFYDELVSSGALSHGLSNQTMELF